jgi:hypothetical protein
MHTETETITRARWQNNLELKGLIPNPDGSIDGILRLRGGWVVPPNWLEPDPKRSDDVSVPVQEFADRIGAHMGVSGVAVVAAWSAAIDDVMAAADALKKASVAP